MNPETVYVLALTYKIRFYDSDAGACYAGCGHRILSIHRHHAFANDLATRFNPVLTLVEAETIAFPIQASSLAFKKQFGFAPYEMDQDAYDFKLVVESYTLEP